MIFSKLFKKKKWLSEKVSERLAAVAELEIDANGNKAILHELAFNDGDEKVRRATLEKLNDFSLWWQAYKNDHADALKKLAEKRILQALRGELECNLDASLKKQFVEQCNKVALLEQVLFELNDEQLITETLLRLNKDNLVFKAITETDLSLAAKTQLIDNVDDVNQLKKLAKKLSGETANLVEDKVSQIQQAAERPVKLEKQLRLLLAQLNALKDKSDFAEVEQKQTQLELEWQQADLSILAEDVKAELVSKLETITESLSRIQAPLREAWEQEQKQAELKQLQQANYEKVTQQLTEIEAEVTAAVAEDNELQQESISSKINEITRLCNELDLTDNAKAELISRGESIFNRANQVPQIKQAIVKAKALLEQLKALELPTDLKSLNEVNQSFKTVRNEWQDNVKQVGISLPTELDAEYKTLFEQWKSATQKLEKEQGQLFSQTRRKLTELEQLIRQGKFKSAFGLYKKLTYWREDLNDYHLNQIANKWQSIEEQVAELQDLQKSFSNPKKQELLDDIRVLADTPLVDPTEQAHRVRMLRKNWQSLGHSGDDEEVALNEQFDQLCEQAFAPCREHYKELEDEREANLKAKLLLIEQLETIQSNLQSQAVSDWRELESMFVKLTRLWHDTGLVDKEKVAEVNQRFHNATKPIKKVIADHHKQNAESKQQLIKQAETVAAGDASLDEKINQLKNLQSKWQKVGFSGKAVDQKLWEQFRAVNNPVFAQRDEAKKEQRAEAEQQSEELFSQLNEAESLLAEAEELAQIREVQDKVTATLASVSGLPKSVYEKLKRKANALTKECENRSVSIRQQAEKHQYQQLFVAVEDLVAGKAANLGELRTAWQTAINTNTKADRAEVTLKIEIVSGLTSPAQDKEQRNQVQMAMLTDKLEQGQDANLEELLEQWLAAGIFEDKDLALIDRIKPAYI